MADKDLFAEFLVKKHARSMGVPEDEVLAIANQETGYRGLDPLSVSPAGARGTMQVMRGTGLRHVTPEEFDTIEGQIKAGVSEWKRLRSKYDKRQSAAGYHGGEGAIKNPSASYDKYAKITSDQYSKEVFGDDDEEDLYQQFLKKKAPQGAAPPQVDLSKIKARAGAISSIPPPKAQGTRPPAPSSAPPPTAFDWKAATQKLKQQPVPQQTTKLDTARHRFIAGANKPRVRDVVSTVTSKPEKWIRPPATAVPDIAPSEKFARKFGTASLSDIPKVALRTLTGIGTDIAQVPATIVADISEAISGETPATRGLKAAAPEFQRSVEEALPLQSPESFWTADLPGAITGTVPYTFLPSARAVAGMGAVTGAGQSFKESQAAGADKGMQYTAAIINALGGASEVVGAGGAGVRARLSPGRRLFDTMKREGVQEFFQGGGQQMIANLSAQGYDPNRKIDQDVLEQSLMGLIVGPIVGGGSQAIANAADARIQAREMASAINEQMKATLTPEGTVVESDDTLRAQLESVYEGNKPAVLLPPNHPLSKVKVAPGFTKTRVPGHGDVIHPATGEGAMRPSDVKAAFREGRSSEILGHVSEKPEEGSPSVNVVARDAETGVEQLASVVPPEAAEAQAEATQAQFPQSVVQTEDPLMTIAERMKKREAERAQQGAERTTAEPIERRQSDIGPPEGVSERRGAIVGEAKPPTSQEETLRGALKVAREERRSAQRDADTDALTGVNNRRALDRALPSAESDPDTSVISFDANNFGQVNKLKGEVEGDKMLKDVADAITAAAREISPNARVFRRGGDEIVVLAPKDVAEQIRTRAEEIFGEHTVEGDGKSVTVSLSGSVGDTFEAANAPLQEAKRARKAAQVKVPAAVTEEMKTEAKPATAPVSPTAAESKAKAETKEPWEMTREEYELSPNAKPLVWERQGDREYGYTPAHKKEVEIAIAEGKPVSPEVLADYPDLKPAPAAEAKAAEAKPHVKAETKPDVSGKGKEAFLIEKVGRVPKGFVGEFELPDGRTANLHKVGEGKWRVVLPKEFGRGESVAESPVLEHGDFEKIGSLQVTGNRRVNRWRLSAAGAAKFEGIRPSATTEISAPKPKARKTVDKSQWAKGQRAAITGQESLNVFIHKMGGINPNTQEAKDIRSHVTRPGYWSKDGVDIDFMMRSANDHGYGPFETLRDFQEAIKDEARGRKSYSSALDANKIADEQYKVWAEGDEMRGDSEIDLLMDKAQTDSILSPLYDKLLSDEGLTDAEKATFRKRSKELGIPPSITEDTLNLPIFGDELFEPTTPPLAPRAEVPAAESVETPKTAEGQLTTTEIDRVREKYEELKASSQNTDKAIDDFVAQGGLFGQEFTPEMKAELRAMRERDKQRRAKDTSEQGALFETEPTLESEQQKRAAEPPPPAVKSPLEQASERLTAAEEKPSPATEAWERIKERGKTQRRSGLLSDEDLKDLLIIAKHYISQGAREIADIAEKVYQWAKEHVSEAFADRIRPHLDEIVQGAMEPHHSELQPKNELGQYSGPPEGYTPKAEREGRQEERSLPKTLEAAGLPSGDDLIYDVVSNPQAVASARANIESKGLDGAAEYVRGESEPSAELTATGIAVISDYVKAGKVKEANEMASDLSAKLTRYGQAVQAVKVLNLVSPEGALMAAQKIAKKARKTVTEVAATRITGAATDVQESQKKIKELESVIAKYEAAKEAKRKSAKRKIIDTLSAAETAARERLAKIIKKPAVTVKPGERGMARIRVEQADPQVINDLAAVMASMTAKGDTKLVNMRDAMSADFGDTFLDNRFAVERAADRLLREANRKPKGEAKPPTPRAELRKAVSEAEQWNAGIKADATANPDDPIAYGAELLAREVKDRPRLSEWQKAMRDRFGKNADKNYRNWFVAAEQKVRNARAEHRELGEIRRAHETGAVTDEQVAGVRKKLKEAQKQHREASLMLAREFDKLSGGRFWHLASAARKSLGMLLSPVTHGRNILGNAAWAGFDEVSKLPSAAFDFALSAAHHGERSIGGISPTGVLTGIADAFRKGVPEAAHMIRHGVTPEEAAKLQFPEEINTGVKVVDLAVSASFRLMAAEDRIFYNGHLTRNLYDRARIQALNEAKSGKINRADVPKRTREIIKSPSDEMKADAEYDALVSTFNNNNRLSNAIRRFRSGLTPAENFALDLIMPFDRTPTNIIARLIEASPMGVVRAVGKTAAAASRAIYDKARRIEHQALTQAERRAITQSFGRGVTGSGLIYLGWKLAAAGLMTGLYDDSDDMKDIAEKKKAKMAGRQPLSLRVGDQWIQIGTLSPVGKLLSIGASMRTEGWGELPSVAANAFFDQPLMEGIGELTKIQKGEREFEQYTGRLVSSFIPTPLRDLASLLDDKARKTYGFKGQIYSRIPGLRTKLEEDKGMEYRRSWVIDPFHTKTAREPVRPFMPKGNKQTSGPAFPGLDIDPMKDIRQLLQPPR